MTKHSGEGLLTHRLLVRFAHNLSPCLSVAVDKFLSEENADILPGDGAVKITLDNHDKKITRWLPSQDSNLG